MKTIQTILLAALCLILTACAQVPKQAFNKEMATHINGIALTNYPNQEEYQATIVAHPGMSFGLIGALVAAADSSAKTAKLSKAIDTNETRLQDRFTEKLLAALSTSGYTMSKLLVAKDSPPERLIADAKKANTQALLDVKLSGGYLAAGPGSNYQPSLVANVKLTDLGDGKSLYEDVISYGFQLPGSQSIHTSSAPPEHAFSSMDTLTEKPQITREGLIKGLDALVAQIVADIRKK